MKRKKNSLFGEEPTRVLVKIQVNRMTKKERRKKRSNSRWTKEEVCAPASRPGPGKEGSTLSLYRGKIRTFFRGKRKKKVLIFEKLKRETRGTGFVRKPRSTGQQRPMT